MLLAAAGVSLVLVALFYSRAFRFLSGIEWTQLYLLRVVAIVIVLLLLFRPVLTYQRDETERKTIVFVVDASGSMSIADDSGGSTRLELARDKVGAWWTKLRPDFDLKAVKLSDVARPLERLDDLQTIAADAKATSLSRGLASAAKTAPAAKIEAVFLLSDGIHNAAGNPADFAGRLGVPVNTIGIGNSLRDQAANRDIRLTDISCPDQLAVQNRARVTALVDATGFGGRVVEAELREDDKPVAQQQLTLDNVDGSQEVVFEFVPETKGLHTYTARIAPAPDEKIPQNNQRSTTALVIDARIRVLYLEGTLRAEYGALTGRFLSKDPNLEFCALVQTRPNVFSQRSNIEKLDLKQIPDDAETLKQFNVFLLGDLDASYYQGPRLELIRDRVRDGAGLLMMGGYHSLGPGGFGGTPLEEALPVRLGDREIGQVDDPFVPVLTPDGRNHPIFANIRQFFPTREKEADEPGLPMLEGGSRVIGSKPGATVLAHHPTETVQGGGPLPVLAVQSFGKGRTAVFTGDTTRNWQQALRSLDRESPFLRFWGQTVRWLAGRSDQFQSEAGIVATADKAYYEPDSKSVLTAVVRGKDGEAGAGAKVVASIKGPTGPPVQLDMVALPGPAGNHRVEYDLAAPGRYEIAVTAELAGQQLRAEKIAFDVGRPNLEFDRLDLDERTLQQIADSSRGRYAHITTADRMIDALQRRQQKRRVEYEMQLAWPPVCWTLFVVALTGEWLLRRRYQLR